MPPSRNTSHAACVDTGLAVETAYDAVLTGTIPERYTVAISGLVARFWVVGAGPGGGGALAIGVPLGTSAQVAAGSLCGFSSDAHAASMPTQRAAANEARIAVPIPVTGPITEP